MTGEKNLNLLFKLFLTFGNACRILSNNFDPIAFKNPITIGKETNAKSPVTEPIF